MTVKQYRMAKISEKQIFRDALEIQVGGTKEQSVQGIAIRIHQFNHTSLIIPCDIHILGRSSLLMQLGLPTYFLFREDSSSGNSLIGSSSKPESNRERELILQRKERMLGRQKHHVSSRGPRLATIPPTHLKPTHPHGLPSAHFLQEVSSEYSNPY